MGQVFRAHDSRLGREVAIKVVLESSRSSPDLRSRFEAEARLIARLQHPNVCSLFDIGEHEGSLFLVMELLEGRPLATRLDAGPFPIPEALRIASEIASALDAAHHLGIIHRDLKPGNIFLTRSGAKLLDFGIARLIPSSGLASPPTETLPITGPGMVVGTVPYMSPEQVEGRPADARSDIFALGHVLYEMLTGHRAFRADTSAALMSAILRESPPAISQSRPGLSPALERLVYRCLDKNPEERWQSARDLARELQWLSTSSLTTPALPSAPPSALKRYWPLLALPLLLAAGWFILRPVPSSPPLAIPPAVIQLRASDMPKPITGGVLISPSGKRLVLGCGVSANSSDFCIYDLRSARIDVLPSGGNLTGPAMWSPDESALVYQQSNALVMHDLQTKSKEVLFPNLSPCWLDWGTNNRILVLNSKSEVFSLDPVTKEAKLLFQASRSTAHLQWLPGHQQILLTTINVATRASETVIRDLASGKDTRLHAGEGLPLFVSPDKLFFIRGNALMVQSVDLRSQRLLDRPALVVQPTAVAATQNFSVNPLGLLAHWPMANMGPSQLLWVDRQGSPVSAPSPPGLYYSPRTSPDGKLALVTAGPNMSSRDIWLWDSSRNVTRQLTDHPDDDGVPLWAPDGKSFVFASNRSRNRELFRLSLSAGATPEHLIDAEPGLTPHSWTPDGKKLAVTSNNASFIFDLPTRQRTPFLPGKRTGSLKFSPDGKWILFDMGREGLRSLVLSAYPEGGEVWPVSKESASNGLWRADMNEIYFRSPDGSICAIPLEFRSGQPVFGPSRRLFTPTAFPSDSYRSYFDVSPDGQRFLMNYIADSNRESVPIEILVNWQALLPSAPK